MVDTAGLQNLNRHDKIVNEDGTPTEFFMRILQGKTTNDVSTADQLAAITAELNAIYGAQINTTAPIHGGDLIRNNPTISHDNSAVVPNTYGDATNVPQFTVDQKGHITGVTLVPISGGGGGGMSPFYNSPADLTKPVAANLTLTNGAGLSATLNDLATRGVVQKATASSGLLLSTAMITAYTPPAAGTDFTVTAFLNRPPGDNFGIGICIKDNTGKVAQFGTRNGDAGGSYWNSETSVSSGFSWYSSGGLGFFQIPMWIRVQRIGTNFVTSYSMDGEIWAIQNTVSATAFLGSSLSKVGFGMWLNGFREQKALSCFSLSAA